MEFPGSQYAGDYEGWPEDRETMIVEPKLDGYRLSCVVDGFGKVSFHCREDEEPGWAENLGHLREALGSVRPFRSSMVDAELQATTWNETSHLVRRKRANMSDELKEQCRTQLKLHIFDLVPLEKPPSVYTLPRRRKPTEIIAMPFRARRQKLEAAFTSMPGDALSVLRLVPQFTEYEGAMVKDPTAPYALDDRTPWWLKLKPMISVDMVITGVVEGLGKHVGRLGALVCIDSKGRTVSVGGGFTDEQRENLWRRQKDLPGMEIEVKIQKSDVATARHPVFMRFRNEKNQAALVAKNV
jgi:ATP-dependent DNA ligase